MNTPPGTPNPQRRCGWCPTASTRSRDTRAPGIRQTQHPRFGYLGTLQYVNMPMAEFLQGWGMAFPAPEARAEAVFRGKLSASGAAGAEILETFGSASQNGLTYEGPISKRDVARFYGSVDALLLLLSTGKFVTGGKTAEYLATGLPIVSVHDLGNAATELLRDYPLWFPAKDLTPGSIAAALQECADALAHPDERRVGCRLGIRPAVRPQRHPGTRHFRSAEPRGPPGPAAAGGRKE